MSDLSEKIEIVARTDTGMKRGHNEDSVGTRPALGLAILADGMGGYKAGEIASAIAVNTVIDEMESQFGDEAIMLGLLEEESEYTPQSLLLRNIIEHANKVIHDSAKSQPQYNGMGTTIVGLHFFDNKISVAHVGDSRLYRFRNNALELITSDHTLLRELIERGFYTEEEARQSSNKNLVTRALGVESDVQVDIGEDIALTDDIYLMCSDGLNDMITDEEIRLTIENFGDNLEITAQQLIDLANQNGGHDNVSVILARPLKPFPADQGLIGKVVDWFF